MSFPIRASFGTVVVEPVPCGPRGAFGDSFGDSFDGPFDSFAGPFGRPPSRREGTSRSWCELPRGVPGLSLHTDMVSISEYPMQPSSPSASAKESCLRSIVVQTFASSMAWWWWRWWW